MRLVVLLRFAATKVLLAVALVVLEAFVAFEALEALVRFVEIA